MKAIREARLIGTFLVMIALGVLLKSHFSVAVLATLSSPLVIRWHFNWDEAKYQYFIKRRVKMTRVEKLEQTKILADLWYKQQKSQLYIAQQKERRGIA